jgi:hypothetical protein
VRNIAALDPVSRDRELAHFGIPNVKPLFARHCYLFELPG